MRDLFAGWRFAWHRLRAGWRFMAIAAAGVLAAATLLALAPIYTAAMSDLGLQFRLDRDLGDTTDRLATIEVDRLGVADAADRARRHAIAEITEARIGGLSDEILVEERSEHLTVTFPGVEEPESPVTPPDDASEPLYQPWGAFLHWMSDLVEQVDVVSGRLPGPSEEGAEVVVPAGFEGPHLALGDEIVIEGPAYDDCPDIPASEDPETFQDEVQCVPTARVDSLASATVVGFVEPSDPADPRWSIFQVEWEAPAEPFLPRIDHLTEDDELFRARALRGEGSMPLLTTHEQYFGPFAQRLPEMQSRYRTGFLMESDVVGLGEVPYAIEDLRGWVSDVRGGLDLPVASRIRPLDSLERFQNVQSFSQVPLLLILLQVVAIVLYYVMIVMSMLLERQSEEIAVYRSRGANTTQLLGLTLVEGLVLAIPALLIGPSLAGGLVAILGLTPVFSPATDGSLLPVSISAEAYAMGAGGAIIALLAILLPAYVVARRGIVDVKREQSRPAGRNLIQRYYLDFGVVLLAGLLLWQLDQRGSVFDPGSVGGWSSDPMLLLSPLVVTLAVALMVLRLYPPLLRLAVRVLLTLRGTAVAIGLRRAGRAPAAYARLVLLLVMAAAVGTFAASYGPTVDRSFDERGRYEAGAGLRAPLDEARMPSAEALEAVREHPGVADVTTALRGEIETPGGESVPLLALDAPRGSEFLWSREDFMGEEFDSALGLLGGALPPGGIDLPPDMMALEISLRSENVERAFIRARFRDENGTHYGRAFDLPEEIQLDEDGWVTARTRDVPPSRDVHFTGLLVTDRAGQSLRTGGTLHIDSLTVVREDGSREVVEDFSSAGWMMFDAQHMEEQFTLTDEAAHSGDQAAEWTWAETIMPGRRVLAPIDPAVPLAMIADPITAVRVGAANDGSGRVIMDDVSVPVAVREHADLFPTLDPDSGFLVANHEHLRSLAGILDFTRLLHPSELWVEFSHEASLADQHEIIAWLGGSDSPLAIDTARAVHRDAMLDETGSDPTLQASGSGILIVAFGAVLGLSMLGFVVTLVLSARSRLLEFAVLRAIGASPREILRALVFEWGIVLAVGIAIGVILGRQVARLMLSFLEVTADGERVLPPFILVTDWWTLGLGIAALVGVVIAALGIAWASSIRQADASELRLTR